MRLVLLVLGLLTLSACDDVAGINTHELYPEGGSDGGSTAGEGGMVNGPADAGVVGVGAPG
jgi:hypothetical protein